MESQIIEYNEFETNLIAFKDQYDGVLYDLSIEEDEKKAKSDRLSIGKVISRLDSVHKELKAPLKAKTDLIDSERKRIKDDLLIVQGKIKAQLTAHEEQKQKHIEMLQQKVDDIRNLSDFDGFEITAKSVQINIDLLEQVVIDDSYEYREVDAQQARAEGLDLLKKTLYIHKQQESDKAELEKLKSEKIESDRKEREANIAKEAAQNAIEQERRDSANKVAEAKRKQKASENAASKAKREAKDKAEQAVTKERQRIEREQEQKRQEAVRSAARDKAKRETQTNREKVHAAIKDGFIEFGLTSDVSIDLVNAIIAGRIPELTIEY